MGQGAKKETPKNGFSKSPVGMPKGKKHVVPKSHNTAGNKPSAIKSSSAKDNGGEKFSARSVLERKEISRLIQKGKERGTISFDELNEGLGPEVNSLEEIENVIAVLAEADIEVVDESTKGFPELMPRDGEEDFE